MKAIVSIKKGLAMVLAAALTIGSLTVPANAANDTVPEEKIVLEVGDPTVTLTVTSDTATSDDANAHEITWEQEGTSGVVTVSASDGSSTAKITAVGKGTCTIKAKKGGDLYKTWKITVSNKTLIAIRPATVELAEGSSMSLEAIVTSDDANASVTWTSDEENGVIVSPGDGTRKKVTITAKDKELERTATILATVKNAKNQNVTAECKVKVISTKEQATSVSLNKTTLDLTVGGSATLTASVKPENASAASKAITWSSNAHNVATVDRNGTVTAVGAGTATITATTGNGKKATCTVTVTAAGQTVAVTGVTVTPSTLKLNVNETYTLTATVLPENATNQNVTWSTSAPAVATIDAKTRVVKAVGVGTATITATTEDGEKTGTCVVTVSAATTNVPVTGVSLNAKTLVVGKGATRALTATLAPENATNKTVAWKSSATAIATVDAKGNVKGIKKGTATITATTADGNKIAACTVTVTEVTLNSTALTLGFGQSSTALKATLSNAKADRLTSWKTSNAAIVKVDARTGKLTAANKAGTANITVTTQAGATATCRVTVKLMTTKLTMSKTKLELAKGKSATLKVTRTPGNATEKITWSSSNSKVATVTQKGKVSAKKTGTVTITAQAANGVKATCKVTIKKASLKLKKTKGTVKVGKSLKIQVKSSFPKKDKIKSYKSSNSKIAKVDKKGKVTGKKKGTAKITVTTKSGAKATFKVTVKK